MGGAGGFLKVKVRAGAFWCHAYPSPSVVTRKTLSRTENAELGHTAVAGWALFTPLLCKDGGLGARTGHSRD